MRCLEAGRPNAASREHLRTYGRPNQMPQSLLLALLFLCSVSLLTVGTGQARHPCHLSLIRQLLPDFQAPS